MNLAAEPERGNGNKPVGNAAHVFESCGFDRVWARDRDEAIFMAQVKPALEQFAIYRQQVDAVDGALLDTLLLEWLQGGFGLRESPIGAGNV